MISLEKDWIFQLLLSKLKRNAELPGDLCTNPYIEYVLKYPGKSEDSDLIDSTFKTGEIEGNYTEVDFCYCKHHFYEKVDEKILVYLLKNNVG